MITKRSNKDLSFVSKAAEGLTVDNAISIPLESSAHW